jgi:hypothetical protein
VTLQLGKNDRGAAGDEQDEDDERNDGEDEEFEDTDILDQTGGIGRTFEEAMNEDIDLITEFLAGQKFQMQFRDQCMLNTLEREGAVV